MTKKLARILCFLPLVTVAVPAAAKSGDTLYIQGENVNIRSAPRLNASVTTRLDRGHRVIERGRKSGWVSVEITGPGAAKGWVHSSLVGPDGPSADEPITVGKGFEGFRSAVQALDRSVLRTTGIRSFTKTENLGDGMVQLTATKEWAAQPDADRRKILDALVDMWNAADRTGQPILVRIVDDQGDMVMNASRGYQAKRTKR